MYVHICVYWSLDLRLPGLQECPTVWRLYEYYSGEDQVKTMELRHSKQDLPLGKGGEGYVADDDWCYNCGDLGHLGDVRVILHQ